MKKNILVVLGGQSGEHEVSLMSALSVLKAVDEKKYGIVPVGISKQGTWKFFDEPLNTLREKSWQELRDYLEKEEEQDLSLRTNTQKDPKGQLVLWNQHRKEAIDLVFPVLHGPLGEDGTIQGMCEMLNVPYVGAGVLASSVAMDKAMTKNIVSTLGILQAEYHLVLKEEYQKNEKERERQKQLIEKRFSYPVFIKPANLGSSVGITKAHNAQELLEGIDLALSFDRKVLVEEFIDAREIECGILGNYSPKASLPSEIIPHNEFYDYRDKYFDGKSQFVIPAKLTKEQREKIQDQGKRIFKAMGCTGLARIDFFVEKTTGAIYFNEINTMPGFTKISMYPKMWEATGIAYEALIEELIELGFRRFHKNEG
ncbi:D-alanine--D-alanine ligase family protein [Isachenkonia alkalipeptolytica]|uniref:D-alanine--D-alanine ligase n=1 Tax=Isachenkonia alkalipeptolytica TaxID=2565777 RepID=A0AA44BDL5_9CLOT|nr:D-alanine--D-alanine ligase family protein [Isachenkonia alkalipeptolytica]NBG88048.1 D-alanine--D-alanine ligase [Isachenkonia alkalipeptolytica]